MTIDIPPFDGQDDYLPDSALDLIDALVVKMPTSDWEVGHMQGATKSVTATIRFDGIVGPIGQIEALESLLQSSTVVGTLARNLRYERERLAAIAGECEVEDHPLAVRVEQILNQQVPS